MIEVETKIGCEGGKHPASTLVSFYRVADMINATDGTDCFMVIMNEQSLFRKYFETNCHFPSQFISRNNTPISTFLRDSDAVAQTLNWQAGHGCQPGLATVLTLNRRAAAAVRPCGSDSELFSLKVGRFFLRDSLF